MIAIIADDDALLGFQLAGVKRAYRYSPDSFADTLEKCADATVLIVTEEVAEQLRGIRIKPVLAVVPGKRGSTGTALRNLGRLLEEAIGVQLKE